MIILNVTYILLYVTNIYLQVTVLRVFNVCLCVKSKDLSAIDV